MENDLSVVLVVVSAYALTTMLLRRFAPSLVLPDAVSLRNPRHRLALCVNVGVMFAAGVALHLLARAVWGTPTGAN